MTSASVKTSYSLPQVLVNGGGQTLAWYVCVVSAAREQYVWAPISLVILLLLHGFLHPRPVWSTTAKLLILGIGFGLAFDTLLIAMGVYIPMRWFMPAPWAPLWFVILWANFAMCLHVAFRALQHRPVLAAIIGAIFGPSAYLGAGRLGAVVLPEPRTWRLIALSLAWALAVWTLTQLARRIDPTHKESRYQDRYHNEGRSSAPHRYATIPSSSRIKS